MIGEKLNYQVNELNRTRDYFIKRITENYNFIHNASKTDEFYKILSRLLEEKN